MRAALASLAAAAVAAAFPAPAGSGDPPVAAAPDGLLVLAVLSPERAMVADPRTGATAARVLPGGTLCHGPLLAVGRHVVYAGSRGGRAVTLAAPVEQPGDARSLGPGHAVAAASAPGRLWLGNHTREGVNTARMSLREVGVDGRVLSRSSLLVPRWGRPAGVVDGGLLISRGRGLVLRRPQRPRLLIRNGWPLAAAGSRFAWCPRGCRRLGVWSARRGGRMLDPPPGVRPDDRGQPAFSPDATRLALPVRTPGGSRVAVVDLERGRWSVVPGARIAGYRATAWSPSGRWLYFTGPGDRVLAARGGSDRPVRLPIRTGGTVMSIASTPGSAVR